MSRREALEAELKEVALEEELVRLKEDENADEDELRQVKNDLREARAERREFTAGTANPEVISASAGVNGEEN